MKTKKGTVIFLLILALCLALTCGKKSEPFIRNVAWEMSPAEVDNAENGQGVMWTEYNLYTVTNVEHYGYTCGITYEFKNDKLSKATVLFDDISDTKFGYIYKALISDMGEEGEILEAFENSTLPLLKVQWTTDSAIITATYCDGTKNVPKSASIDYSPTK